MKKRARAAAAAGLWWATGAAQAVGIVAVAPQGEVAQVRQASVTFSEPVVPLGDPRLADPFSVVCAGAAAAGSGRWTSERAWVWDFRDPLPPGTRCTATLRPQWKPTASVPGAASSGAAATLTGPRSFTFSTGGPAIVSMQPGDGAEIEEDQHFLIRLSGPAVEASVVAHAACEVEGIGERLPLRLVGGELREQLL